MMSDGGGIRKYVMKKSQIKNRQCIVTALYLVFALSCCRAFAQEGTTVPVKMPLRLKFKDADIEFVLADYSEKTGRTLLLAPNLPKVKITLQNQTDLTMEEYLKAIDTILGMNGIVLLKVDDKFLKVVPSAQARQEEMDIRESVDKAPIKETGELVSLMIPLKHIDPGEAQKAIDALKHPYGKIQLFDLVNSILITDTAANINRMTQILKYIDQPIEAREEPHIIEIRFAKASDIKKKLEEIMADAGEKAKKVVIPRQKPSGAPGVVKPSPPGVIRAREPAKPLEEEEIERIAEIIEEAERGIIRGRVKIVADDKTNILIIITRPENMMFFEKIVKVLDVETEPEVIVRVFRLEFAEAKAVAGMLNDLIGAVTSKEEPKSAVAKAETPEAKSAALKEYVERKEVVRPALERKSKVGELSKENIKILSDERTNSLIIMASKSDLKTIEEIIKDMDMMLSQVLIEAVIVEVTLDDDISTGIDWIQHSMIAYDQKADGTRSPITAFTGRGGGGTLGPSDATGSPSWPTDDDGKPLHGLTYYFTLFGLNMDLVVRAASSDARSRVLQAPVILTTDNKEAVITSTERIYVYKGMTWQGDQAVEDYGTENVGLTLKVKPQINKNKVVMMNVSQTVSEPGYVGEPQAGRTVSSDRTVEAFVAVKDRQTIVLGGLVRNQTAKSRSKIPLLGDIPILGRLFSYSSSGEGRRELVVFITPYVVDTPEQIEAETVRRKRALDMEGLWKRGWSDSKLAEDDSKSKQATTTPEPETKEEVPAEDQQNSTSRLDPDFIKSIRWREKRLLKTLENIDKDIEKDIQETESVAEP